MVAGPIDLDGELAEPEHWKTLLTSIYFYFIRNPVDNIPIFEYELYTECDIDVFVGYIKPINSYSIGNHTNQYF